MPIGIRSQDLQDAFESAVHWEDYLDGDPAKAEAWRETRSQVHLGPDQERLLSTFTRRMPILMISGIWCGDCVRQGPVLQALADATPCIELKYIDRDAVPHLMKELAINDGHRVPMVVYMAEDFEPVSVMGDRTLRYYRHLAAKNVGAGCPLPGAPAGGTLLEDLVSDWLNEFERVHLLLRLSGRLRGIHQD